MKNILNITLFLGFLAVIVVSAYFGNMLVTNKTTAIVGLVAIAIVSIIIVTVYNSFLKNNVYESMAEIETASKELSQLATNMTNNNHKLAESTAEQAAAIKQTSVSIEETISQAHMSAENTYQADLLAKETQDYVNKGTEQMNIMKSSMKELKTSSDEIGKIIKVVDEIAFQTNILSLNAAVEAARAGDAGKGFAVVAEEVRNLAQRSAEAAKDTTSIIENNIKLSEKCLTISEDVDCVLLEIEDKSSKVKGLLSDVANMAKESEKGIEQISRAIRIMENVLNVNSETAQNNSKTANELSSFADKIKKIINGTHSTDSKSTKKVEVKSYVKKETKKTDNKTKKVTPVAKKEDKKVSVQPTNKTIEKPVVKETPKVETAPKQPQVQNAIPPMAENQKINPNDIIPLDDF